MTGSCSTSSSTAGSPSEPRRPKTRAYALDVVLRDRNRKLWEAVLIAIAGEYADGSPVEDWGVRQKALDRLETARLKGIESWKDPRTGEIHLATGDSRSAHERCTVRTPPSTRKVSSNVRARALLEAECAERRWDFRATIAPLGIGRPSKEESARRARLAVVVAAVREAGVTLDAIGEAIEMPKQRSHELAKVGDALRARLSA